MLRFFQIITTAGLIWMGWLVFSADFGELGSRSSDKSPVSERKLSVQGAGYSNDANSLVGHHVRRSRSLDELLNTLAVIRKEIGPDDESEETLPEEVQDFVNGLDALEAERLARNLQEVSAEIPDHHLSLYFQLIQQWGKLAPGPALAFARELSASDKDWQNVFGYTFLGWASVAPLEAWDGFREVINAGDDFSGDHFFMDLIMDRVRRNLLGSLAKKHPDLALRLIAGSGRSVDGDWISWESRDSVFQNLPEGQDWAGIAQEFKDAKFGPGEPAALMLIRGPGPELFVRWANEEPVQASEWFQKERAASDKSSFDGDWEQLMNSWHESSPEKSLLWIEEQIVSGQEEEKYLDTLRYLFDSSSVGEPTIRAARLLPDQDERFKILKLAAHSADYDGHFSRDPFAAQQNPMSQAPELVANLIPQFQLSAPQVSQIKSIIEARQNQEK